MTILRLTVCGILLFTGLLWLPLAGWSQGKKWTDKECRVRMEELFKDAKDPSVDLGEVTDNLSIRAGTEFAMNCGIREAKSIKILERQLGGLVAEREQTDESEGRTDKSGKHAENFKSRSSPYDPSGKSPAKTAGQSAKSQVVDKFLQDCSGKSVKNANCDKLRKDFVEILKEDLLRLGSTANRKYMPAILRMFWSDEVELRIAAADAIGMIGPEDSDVEALAPLINDPAPDVRQAVSHMLSRGKGTAVALLKQRSMPMRTGRTPETPVDAGKYSMPVAPDSAYLFDTSDAAVGRLSYVAKGKSDPASFFKAKAKKGPFKLEEFQEKYRFQIQDEQEALTEAQQAEGKEIKNMQPPDPTNLQAFTEYMEKIASVGARQGSRISLDSYYPTLFGSPTVYVLEERQIGQRSYPTRYVVLYQELAFKRPGYRLSWITVPDDTIKTAQAASIAEEKEELARNKEREARKKRGEALDALTKKKDAAEKKQFKKGQADLEKELGF